MGIRAKILSITVIILIIGITAEVVTCGYLFTREYSWAIQSRAIVLGESLRSQLDRIFSLGIDLHELVGFEKQCQELVERNSDIEYAMVLDLNGRVLFHNDPLRYRDGTSTPVGTGVKNQGSVSPHYTENEKSYEVVVPVLNSQDEKIAAIHIGIGAGVIDEKITYLMKYSAIVSLVALSMAVALLLFALGRWVTKPLSELFDAIHQLKRNESGFYSKIRVASGDEIGHVGSAFNNLLDDLNASHETISLHTEKLESTVDRRTYELRELNEQLERDIAERKKIEEALRENESNYRNLSQEFHTLLDTIPDAIGLYSSDLRIIWTNRHAAERYVEDPSTLQGEHCYKVWHNRTAPCETCAVQMSFQTGAKASNIVTRPDGRLLETRSVPLREADGNIVSVMEIGRDITEQHKLESQLRQAQKLEAIGTIAGGIAHDFNNILAAIFGYTELSLLELPEESPVRNKLEQVMQASRRAKELVKQILVFSRHEDWQQKSAISIAPLIDESISFLRATLPATIEIRQHIRCEDSNVLANPTEIQQVIINLCTNAAHAMEEKGGILELSLTDLYQDDLSSTHYPDLNPGRYLKLTVSDTGHGMDKATAERIFDPYFTTKEVGKGSGLGLAVVHGIVKRHGGITKVYSEQGKGSSFQVLLPRIEAETMVKSEPAPSIPAGNETILLVDDEVVLVKMGRDILKQLGYRVVAAESSSEALELFRYDPYRYDLVITDYTMPHMTGEDLAREILRIKSDTPILMATGFSERITEERAKSIGIREFIMKPLTRRELGEVVRRTIDAQPLFQLTRQ